MNSLTLRGLTLGEGKPKIIVPLCAGNQEALLQKASALSSHPFDLVEWRADFMDAVHAADTPDHALAAELSRCAKALRGLLGDTPLLFTLRSQKEGGEALLPPSRYMILNQAAAESGAVDLVDVELSCGADCVQENIRRIHAAGVHVIASSHDFQKTPEQAVLTERLLAMQRCGADIAKLAVMPQSAADVLTLLAATEEVHRLHPELPLVTMSMGELGVLSRISGELFGSCMSFAAAGESSAPGQLSAKMLSQLLSVLHEDGRPSVS